jgi:hypothetical protein
VSRGPLEPAEPALSAVGVRPVGAAVGGDLVVSVTTLAGSRPSARPAAVLSSCSIWLIRLHGQTVGAAECDDQRPWLCQVCGK